MSRQRRENRRLRTRCPAGAEGLDPSATLGRANLSGGTASKRILPSDLDLSQRGPKRVATKSLQSDHRIDRLYWIVRSNIRGDCPRFEELTPVAFGVPESLRSSPAPIYSPSGSSRLHPALSEIPAGKRRWAERYDGKGNLHFQYAA